MGQRRFFVAAAILAALISGVALALPSGRSAKASPGAKVGPYDQCVKIGPKGLQLFHGPKPAGVFGVSQLADALQSIADSHQGQVSGVALCTDFSGAMIAVAHPSDRLLAEINALRAQYPHARLVIHYGARGLTAQLAAEVRLSDALTAITRRRAFVVTEFGPNIYTGGMQVEVIKGAWPVSANLRAEIEAAVTDHGAVTMPIDYSIGSPAVPTPSVRHLR